MSLYKLITNDTLDYYPPLGQSETTGSLAWSATKRVIKGRVALGATRYSTQEARDVIYDGSLTSYSDLQEQGRIIYNDQGYLVAEKFEIRKGQSSEISHYNYLLRNYDNSQI
jgi:hypothetical protein